jgi:hypothetical protein
MGVRVTLHAQQRPLLLATRTQRVGKPGITHGALLADRLEGVSVVTGPVRTASRAPSPTTVRARVRAHGGYGSVQSQHRRVQGTREQLAAVAGHQRAVGVGEGDASQNALRGADAGG